MANEKKKLQKAALGLQDSDDEDIEGDIDQQIETMLAPKRIVKEVKASAIGLPNLTGLSNFTYFEFIFLRFHLYLNLRLANIVFLLCFKILIVNYILHSFSLFFSEFKILTLHEN